MPHALLLSPDDQVVNAITAVLEELSVTCDRPLDGISAAQKFSSQSFDLVLVDCENLPAARLIFDVCRRGKNGQAAVPIAIVDGRAGLPTAFRLGAELILTKPVSKDQARTTIRAAVGRVKKDTGPNDVVVPLVESPDVHAVAAVEDAVDTPAMPQLTSYGDPAPNFTAKAAAAAAGASTVADQVAPQSEATGQKAKPVAAKTPASSLFEKPLQESSGQPKSSFPPSDDPVMAQLEQEDVTHQSAPAPAAKTESVTEKNVPVFSAYQQSHKPRGVFVALMTLVIAGGGLYGAWMFEPGFRNIAQPQIDRVLALAGAASTHPAAQPQKPAVQPARTQAAANPPAATPAADANKTPSTTPDSAAATPPAASASSSQAPLSADTSKTAAPQTAATQPVAQQPAPTLPPTTTLSVAHAEVTTTPAVSKTANIRATSKPVQPKKPAPASAAAVDAPLPGESGAVILSSKGAEKRLAHSVAPKYPAGAHVDSTESTIVLKEVVDENGKVAGVRIVEGNPALANAAMQAVKQWRYRPYVRDGKAQPFQTVVILDTQQPAN